MHQMPHDRLERPGAGEHMIPGEPAPTGQFDPAARSYDPLSGPAGAPQQPRPTTVAPYAAPVGARHGTGPMPGPALPEKSVGVAFVLTFFFGPLGMLYSTVAGALILLGITLVVAVVVGVVVGLISLVTFGVGAVLVVLAPLAGIPIWITSMIWGCLAASRHNDRVRALYPQR